MFLYVLDAITMIKLAKTLPDKILNHKNIVARNGFVTDANFRLTNEFYFKLQRSNAWRPLKGRLIFL